MPDIQNRLITLLPSRDRKRFEAQCEYVQLEMGATVCLPGDTLRHVYFPVDSFISLLAVDTENLYLEVGLVGREGMLGMHEVLGVRQAPAKALVQGAGTSLRMGTAAFRAQLKLSGLPPDRPCRTRA